MNPLRTRKQSVLLVVDVQVGVMAVCWDAARIIGNVVRAVERARENGVPVIWVQHDSEELPLGSPQWQLVAELQPLSEETRINKRFPSSFEETDLAAHLAALGADHIILAGAQTNWCIRATAYAALDKGYNLTIVQDAHTTSAIDMGQGQMIEAASMVNDLNITMKWLTYPDRTTTTATAEELAFV
ncbi:nicotinamidase-related amidase [Chitinivorax tropicus]|uniref:Nicotinamidase-related amidase n=1 Tax=Chitinivorax tropicus TaxID=714531 RepID=A0A840MID1_9PROT|nr:isochorismatase family protein [Chitinivorax tropicus]MBB5018408.1 nicotinamidase-related amidase [Chitinivorax tropicus]